MISLLVFYVIVGVMVGLIIYYLYPQYYFSWYPVIPGYYTILGIVLYRSLLFYKKKHPKKLISVYMMMRGIKFLITVLSVLLYTMLVDESVYEFAITIIAFYYFYLFIETYIYIKFEKQKPKINEENI